MFELHQQCLRNQGYEPLDLLGQGSFSSVYTVKDLKSKSLKAVKIIENQLIASSVDEQSIKQDKLTNKENELAANEHNRSIAELKRKKLREHKAGQKYFNREIVTAKRLIQSYHPFIVKIFSLKQTFLYTFIFMEHLSKGNLNDYLNKNGPLEPDDNLAKLWIYQLASALEYLHSIGIAHRDLKLQNIALTERLNVKLIDFGFACRCIINKTNNYKSDEQLVDCGQSKSIENNLNTESSFLIKSSNKQEQIIQFSMSQCGTPLYISPVKNKLI